MITKKLAELKDEREKMTGVFNELRRRSEAIAQQIIKIDGAIEVLTGMKGDSENGDQPVSTIPDED